jgi:tRNA-splicing ligase RtcB
MLVTRKGAISAETGELGIIPMSMGSPSYIVRGKGNLRSMTSSPRGDSR